MWLLLDSIRAQIDAASERGQFFNAEETINLERVSASLGKMEIDGRRAIIPIEGVLTQKRDYMASYFGGGNTLYPDIIRSVEAANTAPYVDEIILAVGYSPGGNVVGLIEAMDAIAASKKPVTALVSGGAMSGAYGLISQADQIVATTRGAQFGSIGVAYDTYVSNAAVSISNTESPNKRPDIKTEEGKAIVREQLDEFHETFAGSIANGRGITVGQVNSNFGRGSVMLADQALKAGMVDSIEHRFTSKPKEERETMDLATLKAEHPAIYQAAVADGVTKERDRVCSHLIMGQASGDMETAVKAVEEGTDMSATLMARYQAAKMKSDTVAARVNDNPKTERVAEPKTQAESYEELVAKEYEKLTGGAA